MANCKVCGNKLGMLGGVNGMCSDCHLASVRIRNSGNPETEGHTKDAVELIAIEREKEIQALTEHSQAIDAILLTTETAPNLNIVRRIEIVTAEVAYGMHIFKDLFADVRDTVGGRSKAIQETMREARRTALYELKKEAHEVGANAVVGVDLDYVELSSRSSMVMLAASGTAVIITENN